MHLDLSKRNTYQYSAVAEHVGCHGPSSHRMDQVRSAGGGGGDGGHPTIIVFCCAICCSGTEWVYSRGTRAAKTSVPCIHFSVTVTTHGETVFL